jgi:hypothetical protein
LNDTLTYSVLIHKATRSPFVASSGHSLHAAIRVASDLYDASKTFGSHGTLATGVSVMVFSDFDAMRIQELKTLQVQDLSKRAYQCGGW